MAHQQHATRRKVIDRHKVKRGRHYMSAVMMYTTRFCPYCIRAKQLLDNKGITYTDICVDSTPAKRKEMMQRSGRRTVPQIWAGETHIGGFDELWALESRGKLDSLLKSAPQ